MSNIRINRINSELQKALSEIINNRLKNPNITAMVSVMRVETTADIKHANVWLSIYKDEDNKTFNAIQHSMGFIKKELANMLKDMRTLPELHFIPDSTLEYSQKINKILEEITKKENND